MLTTSYESLRLDIQDYIEHVSRHNPDRVDPIREYTDDEILTGRSVASPDSMLRIGQVTVPLLRFRLLWGIGSKATAAFAETKTYGQTRRIWLPGVYYARDDTPDIAVTHGDSLVKAWGDLGQVVFGPTRQPDGERRSKELLKEAKGIVEDVSNTNLRNLPRAFLLISTGVASHKQPPGHQ